ncbi:MAG TPA: glycoside hydrolase family 38 C-terminal domain-containing protein [Ktedonobacteraceae bacterium]|nr:glycoside hydrolase family 38 C-terminal domain-containing protein [Ktedonobacteraceae bacterium]
MTGRLNIVLIPHTHWDREWYQTFQQFRIRLVHAVDMLLDIMERDPDFSHFMLDGQTIVLDDYLEIRPEQEERLKKYTRSGRITVGPWYVQPDEFLVSGESLIRNFQIGLKRAAEFGEPMRVGYVPDCFGHIAQLPQILQGVGIDNAVFWRGVGSEAHKSEFYWAAPDGTKTLVLHLAGGMGYSNARDMPLKPGEFATYVELLIKPLLEKATTGTLLFMNGSDHLEPQDGLPATIKAANEQLAHVNPDSYQGIQVRVGTLPQYVAAVQDYLARTGTGSLQTLSGEMRSSQYSHLLPSVLSARMWLKQQNAETEHLLERWLEPMTAWASKLGAPYPAGLIQQAWKLLLQNHPHDSICGCSIDQVHRENRARFAQSQQIGEQLVIQALQHLASSTDTRASALNLAQDEQITREAVPIVAFNPAPGPRTDTVIVDAPIAHMDSHAVIVDERGQRMPHHVVKRWRQEIGSAPVAREMLSAMVAMMDMQEPGEFIAMAEGLLANYIGQPGDGKPYEVAGIQVEEGQKPGVASIEVLLAAAGQGRALQQKLYAAERQILALADRQDIHTLEFTAIDEARETIEFVVADLPAYGLKTFWVLPDAAEVASNTLMSSLVSATNSIENEFYRVEASNQDGTLTVIDKQTSVVLSGLNRFIDGGDIGDLYNYCPPEHDLLVSDLAQPPAIEVALSPTSVKLRVSGQWSLPKAATADRVSRSDERLLCPITSEITLSPGVQRIDIHTSIENMVEDHRIRVTFPVLYTVESVAAEGTFEVRIRPTAAPRPADVADWSEEPVNCFPQKRFVDIGDGKTGMAVLNRGLPEYEVIQDDAGQPAIALTLLRCVAWLSRGDLTTRRGHAGPMLATPEGQCLGHHEFDYALVMHSGDWQAEDALVLREAQAFNMPIRAIATNQHEGSLPSTTSMVEVEPRSIVVSAIKRNGEGVIVRIYNPLSRTVEASLRPGFACEKAFATNLLEERGQQLPWNGREPLRVGLRSGEIATILFI